MEKRRRGRVSKPARKAAKTKKGQEEQKMIPMALLDSYNNAKLYGYSNARVKAMKSKLVGKGVLNEILKTESIPTILARLLQTDYKGYIEEMGDVSQRAELVDLALNKSLVVNIEKLVSIAPKRDVKIMERIVGVWDMYDIKLILYAKAANKDFKYLSRYLIKTKNFDDLFVKEALGEQDFYATANRSHADKELQGRDRRCGRSLQENKQHNRGELRDRQDLFRGSWRRDRIHTEEVAECSESS